MDKIFSKCGMRCDLCLLYRPNVNEDDRRREICSVYSKMFQGFDPDPDTIICDGCSCEKEDPVLFDPMCKTRKCVVAKGLVHCGYCDQYPCDIFPAEPTQEELVQKIDVEKQWTWEDEKLMEAYACKKNMDAFRKDLYMTKNNRDSSVEELFRELSALPQVEAIALGGSRAGEVWDEKSDYDVYLYCTAPVPEDGRRELLGRYCSVMEIGNHFWEYEDNCTLNNGIDIDVLYRNLDDFTADVSSVVENCQSRNGYTTCMWHNLRTCKIVYDRDGRLAAAKARFDVPYPPLLRERIIDRNRKLLRGSMPAYEGQIAKAAKRGDLVSVNHRTAAFLESYFDILFALNNQTHPGEKRLVQLCRKQCEILPERFEENLESLFAHLFSGESVAEDVKRIIDALEALLTDRI